VLCYERSGASCVIVHLGSSIGGALFLQRSATIRCHGRLFGPSALYMLIRSRDLGKINNNTVSRISILFFFYTRTLVHYRSGCMYTGNVRRDNINSAGLNIKRVSGSLVLYENIDQTVMNK